MPVTHNDYTIPACRHSANAVHDGQLATVSGWGTTSSRGDLTDALMEDIKVMEMLNVRLTILFFYALLPMMHENMHFQWIGQEEQ